MLYKDIAMEKILVSSCLLGQPVRYDGRGHAILHPQLNLWQKQNRLIVFCPEVAGGLPTPRSPAEIIQGSVVTNLGEDVTEQFQTGANIALELCKKNQVRLALLKESSPSCGRNTIYDGKHRGVKIEGLGLTTALLIKNGIQVFSEEQIPALIKVLAL